LGGGVTGGGVDLTANHGVVRVKNDEKIPAQKKGEKRNH
jgi:hypothetical protein